MASHSPGCNLARSARARNEVVTTLTGINGPHNLQVSPDGQNVWVVSGHDAMAVMIDGQQLALHGSVATGQEPAHVVVTPDGRGYGYSWHRAVSDLYLVEGWA